MNQLAIQPSVVGNHSLRQLRQIRSTLDLQYKLRRLTSESSQQRRQKVYGRCGHQETRDSAAFSSSVFSPDENGQLNLPCIYRFSVPVLTYLRNDDWSVSTFYANDCPVSHHCFRHSDLLLLPAHLQQASFDSFIHGLFHNIIVGIFCCFTFLETS